MANFTADQLEQIKVQAQEFWRRSEAQMEPYFGQVNDYERAWRARLPADLEAELDEHPDRTALAPPDFYINISSLRSFIRSLLFSERPYGKCSVMGKPHYRGDDIVKIEAVLQGSLDMQSKGRGYESEADKIVHQALYAGAAMSMTVWSTPLERRVLRNQITQEPLAQNGQLVYQKQPMQPHGQTIGIDIRRGRIDPDCDSRDNMRMAGYHYLTRLSDLYQLRNSPDTPYDFNMQDVSKSSFLSEDYWKYVTSDRPREVDSGTLLNKSIDVQHVRGLFVFETAPGNFDFRDLIVELANQQHVIRVQENNLPVNGWEVFDFFSVDQEIGRVLTMGVIEPMFDTWVEKFLKHNQSLDDAGRRTYPVYIADKNSTADLPNTLEYRNGVVYKVDMIASGAQSVGDILQPLPLAASGHDAFTHSGVLENIIQKGMKVNDYTSGVDPQRKETATAVAELVSGGRQLMEHLVSHLKDTGLAPSWRKHILYWQTFRGHLKESIYNERGEVVNIQPGSLLDPYIVDIDIATSLDRPGMTRRIIEMFPAIKDDPHYDGYEVRKTANQLLKLPNRDRLLKDPKDLIIKIHNENLAMTTGVEVIVPPGDHHAFEIEHHTQFVETLAANGDLTPEVEELFNSHIAEHEHYLQLQQAGIANTRDVGGSIPQQNNPNHGAIGVGIGAAQGVTAGRG